MQLNRSALVSVLVIVIVNPVLHGAGVENWPKWRGPHGDGDAGEQQVPLTWSESENILWRADIPGEGNSSPVLYGDRIFLTTADHETQVQSVVCLNRSHGAPLWKTDVHQGNFVDPKQVHAMCTNASCSAACDGERVFVTFMNDDAIWTTALDLDGNRLWQRKVADFESQFGYGASPVCQDGLVLVAVDNAPDNVLVALRADTGEVAWRAQRPAFNSYVTPMVFRVAGQDMVLLSGSNSVAAFQLSSGDEIWATETGAQMAVGSMVTDGERAFVSGGWPQRTTVCVDAATGDVVWQNNAATYIPSMLVHNGYLYAVTNDGIGYCWHAETGREMWRKRLGGNFSASLTLVNQHILAVNEDGVTKVFPASPDELAIVAENELPGLTRATPAICGNRIYFRTDDGLFCIGE